MRRLKYLMTFLMLLLCMSIWSCQQGQEPAPDTPQGQDVQITTGDDTMDDDDDDDEGEDDDDDD